MMGLRFARVVCAVAALVVVGCGGGERRKAGEQPATPVIEPCALLGDEQVGTVLPGHDGGRVARSGDSLVEGIHAYQCSYSAEGADMLAVIINVAVDDERFDELKPSSFAMENAQTLDVADVGWLRGGGDSLKLTALKGRTRIDLALMVAGAEDKADALLELARAVAVGVE